MNTQEIIQSSDAALLHVYNRFPVAFVRGEGVRLFDAEGKDYLDFGSGIGVMAFGYGDREFTEALQQQVATLLHTSNLFYHDMLPEAGKRLADMSGMQKVFFTNSGAEAIEGALKCAKKYAYLKQREKATVIAMEHSFHGRTIGALSVTGNAHYRDPFYPLMDGVSFAAFNDFDSILEQVDEHTCAILLEPIQGEGGVTPAEKEYLSKIRKLCDERDILLIFDEIQCGLCRSGYDYAFQYYGVEPDILTTAKALGGGIPVGAFALNEKAAASSLVPGDHGTTYGGNPLATCAVAQSLRILKERNLSQRVRSMEPVFTDILDQFTEKYGFVLGHRGRGFIQGLVLDPAVPVGKVVSDALSEGLVLLSAGGNVLRFLPPLVMDEAGFSEMREKLERIFDKIS